MDNEAEILKGKRKLYTSAGLILFIGALGLLLIRILVNLISAPISNVIADEGYAEFVIEIIFDLLVQVGFLLLSTLLISRFVLKAKKRNLLEVNNVRKVSPLVCLIAVFIGLLAPAMSYGINLIVNATFISIGVKLPISSSVYPTEFNLGVMLAYIVLTAVLPAVCEEFFNRGVVLTALRSTFNEWQTVLLGGLVFGLFHQYIFQTFYTGAFGMLLVFIALKTRSIVPCIIIHFVNNAVAIISDFADFYNFNFASFSTIISNVTNDTGLLFWVITLGLFGLIGLVYLLIYVDKKARDNAIIKKLNINTKGFKGVSLDILGGPLGDTVYYKPTLKESALWWGAFAIAVACTLASFFWYTL